MNAPSTTFNNKTRREMLGLLKLLTSYKKEAGTLTGLALITTIMNLMIPYLIAKSIDSFSRNRLSLKSTIVELAAIAFGIFIFSSLQAIVQTITSARIAHDLRNQLIEKISSQEYSLFQKFAPGKLLSNLTSDIASISAFMTQAGASAISSGLLIAGAGVFMFLINPQLAFAVFLIVPVLICIFFAVFHKVRPIVRQSQAVADKINRIINETMVGAMLVRLLNTQHAENQKFAAANTEAKNLGLRISGLLAHLYPLVTLSANIATLVIVVAGGHYVIAGQMGLGDFTAFNSYLAILIFPITTLALMSNSAVQAAAANQRISEILAIADKSDKPSLTAPPFGDIALSGVCVKYGKKFVLKNISFAVAAGTRAAIIGPSGSGKTQLLYSIIGLIDTKQGQVTYAGKNLLDYDAASVHEQFGFVFQDSVIFNLSLQENIAFNSHVKSEDLQLAISTAELQGLVESLPAQLNTVLSERGANLSGGQKQRIMLARALALKPSVLLLDDFTARLDMATEKRILHNIRTNYPDMTIISVTQKISTVEDYDQIILLMDGEILSVGTHAQLLASSPEYAQIHESQHSTNDYRLRA